MEDERKTMAVDLIKRCCHGINTEFVSRRKDPSPVLGFINPHTQEAICSLGPASPNWFEEALLWTPKHEKGYITPVQQSHLTLTPSPPLFSPNTADDGLNNRLAGPPETPVALEPVTPGCTSRSQTKGPQRSLKGRSNRLPSETSLGIESPFTISQLLVDTTAIGKHSTPHTFAKSLGIDPDTSQLSWTSSLATPPRSTAKLTSSEDESAADEQFKCAVGPARVLFSPQAQHSDETDVEMESLNFTFDPSHDESPRVQKSSQVSQETEPFSVGEVLSQDENGENRTFCSSGGIEFSCKLSGNMSSLGPRTKRTIDEEDETTCNEDPHEVESVSVGDSESTRGGSDFISKIRVDDVVIGQSETKSKNCDSGQSDPQVPDQSDTKNEQEMADRAVIPGLDSSPAGEVLSLFFKTPPEGVQRRLPPRKKKRLSTLDIDAGVTETHELTTAHLTFGLKPEEASVDVSSAMVSERCFPVTQGIASAIEEHKTGPNKTAESGYEAVLPMTTSTQIPAKDIGEDTTDEVCDTSHLRKEVLLKTPDTLGHPQQISDSMKINRGDDLSQNSLSTLQAMWGQECQKGSEDTPASATKVDVRSVKLESEVSCVGAQGGNNVVGTPGVSSPDGALLFSQISPSTLEAIINETDAVSKQHSLTRNDQGVKQEKEPTYRYPGVDGTSSHEIKSSSRSVQICGDGQGELGCASRSVVNVTPVRWKNSDTPLSSRDTSQKNSKGYDDKIKELHSAFEHVECEESKPLGASRYQNQHAPAADVSKPKARNILGRKRKKFSYPSSSQITETCPSKKFCFGAAQNTDEVPRKEGLGANMEDTKTTPIRDIADHSKTVTALPEESMKSSSTPDTSVERVASPLSSTTKKRPRQAGFTTFSAYVQTCSEKQYLGRKGATQLDENRNVSSKSPVSNHADTRTVKEQRLSPHFNIDKNNSGAAKYHSSDETKLQKEVDEEYIDRPDSVPVKDGGIKAEHAGQRMCGEAAADAVLQNRGKPVKRLSPSDKPSFGEFATAGGRQLKASDEALKWASNVLDEIDGQILVDGDKGKVDVLKNTKKIISSDEVTHRGFATAAGRKLKASDKALEKAAKLLDDEDSLSVKDKCASPTHSTSFIALDSKGPVGSSSEGETLGIALPRRHEIRDEDLASSKLVNTVGVQGFSLASGKGVKISTKQLNKAKKLFDDIDEVGSKVDASLESVPIRMKSSTGTTLEVNGAASGDKEGKQAGFSLASGKGVQISFEKLKRAKSLFDDIQCDDGVKDTAVVSENNPGEKRQSQCLFDKELCEKRSDNAGQFHAQDEQSSAANLRVESIQSASDVKCCGFSLASGKQVEVSEKLLDKVKNLFDDVDWDENIFTDEASDVVDGPRADAVGSMSKSGNVVAGKSGDSVKGDEQGVGEDVADEVEEELVAEEFEGNDGADFEGFTDTQMVRHMDHTLDDFTDTQLCAVTENTDDYYKSLVDREDGPALPEVNKVRDIHMTDSIKAETDPNLVGSEAVPDEFQSGFQTASGYALTVSRSALRSFEECFDNLEELEHSALDGAASVTCHMIKQEEPADTKQEVVSDVAISKVCSEPPASRDNLEQVEKKHIGDGASVHTSMEICEGDFQGFKGFKTAGGSKVKISEKALQSARDKLADCEVETQLPTKTKGGCEGANLQGFGGFMTAAGSKVKISEKALQTARDKLADCDDEEGPLPSKGKDSCEGASLKRFRGFMTARGSKVNISENALETARGKLADCHEEHPLPSKGKDSCVGASLKGFGGFMTAGGSKVKISEKALQSARNKLVDCDEEGLFPSKGKDSCEGASRNGFGGFMTAGGSEVKISEKALQMARDKLAECDVESPLPSKTEDGCEGTNVKGFGGFMTAGGSKVKISDKALQTARNKLAECEVQSSLPAKTQKECEEANLSVQGFGGFMTAGGSKVNISEKALHTARDKLAECDVESPLPSKTEGGCEGTNVKGFGGFMTAGGSKVNISEKALQSARNKLVECELPDSLPTVASGEVNSRQFGGFTTASGSKVKVSEEALQIARDKLGEGTDDDSVLDDFSLIESLRMTEDASELKKTDVCTVTIPNNCVAQKLGFIGGAKIIQAVSFDDGDPKEKKPSKMMMQAVASHAVTSQHAVVEERKSDQGSPMVGVSIGRRDPVKSTPEGTLCDQLPTVGHSRCSVLTTPHGDKNFKKYDSSQQTSFKPHNLLTSKHPTSFITPTKSATAAISKATPSPGLANSFSTPYKKPQDRNFSTPFKATPEGSFRTPFKDTPKNNTDSKSSPVLPQTGPVKRKSLDFSDSPKPKEASPKVTQVVSDVTRTDLSADERSEDQVQSKFSNETIESLTLAWQEERMAQEFTIRKKKKQKICAIPGNLIEMRTSGDPSRVKMKDAVQDGMPGEFSRHQLHQLGVSNNTIAVTAKTAGDFSFNILELFSEGVLMQHPVLVVGDGARLVPNDQGMAGKAEFVSAFLSMPGVDPNLITDSWLCNHYRWIVWKLAAMEVSFPYHFGGRCVTPEQVMLRMKYRYDREVDRCQRSALKKIYERDDTPTKRMVLCVAGVLSLPENNPLGGQAVVELTDGWYGIKTLLDKPLTGMLHAGMICVGQKLCIYGAELMGSQDACLPLEAPADLMLKIFANSTRRSRWDSRLGFCNNPQPFAIPLHSLFPEGGLVGCVEVVVTRVYPMQYMEKIPDGSNVFRSARMEEKIAKQHDKKKETMYEAVEAKIKHEYEKKEKQEKRKKSSSCMKKWTRSELASLQTGQDVYEAMEQSADPGAIQDYLSHQQMTLLDEYRRELVDIQQAELRTEFQKAVADQVSITRQVVPLYKVRVAGAATGDMDRKLSTFLTIWRPSESTIQLLSEGKRLKIYNLAASPGRGWQNKETSLTAMRNTQYKPMAADENFIDLIYEPREVSSIGSLQDPPLYGELDLVGMVVDVPPDTQKHSGFETVLLCDNQENLINLKFWGGLSNYGVEDLLKPGVIVGACNLSWRRDSLNRTIPCAYVSEFTHFTTRPQEPYLRGPLERLCKDITNPQSVIEIMKQKAGDSTASGAGSKITSTPYRPLTRISVSPQQSLTTPLTTSASTPGPDPSSTSLSCRSPLVMGEGSEDIRLSQQRSLQRSKSKRLEVYERTGSGTPLLEVVPLCTPVSSKLRKDFKAPARTPVDSTSNRTPHSGQENRTVVTNLCDEFNDVPGIDFQSKAPIADHVSSVMVTPLVQTGLMKKARRIGLASGRRNRKQSNSGQSVACTKLVVPERCTNSVAQGDTQGANLAITHSVQSVPEGSGDCDIHMIKKENMTDSQNSNKGKGLHSQDNQVDIHDSNIPQHNTCDVEGMSKSSQSQDSDCSTSTEFAKTGQKHRNKPNSDGARQRRSSRLCRRK